MKQLRPISILAITEKRAVAERLLQALHQLLQDCECTVGDLDSGPLILAHRAPDILFCDEPFANGAAPFVRAQLDCVPVVLMAHRGIAPAAPSLHVAAVLDEAALHPRDLEKAIRLALHCRQLDCDSRLRNYVAMINRSPAVVFLWKATKGWPVEFVTENVSQFGYDAADFVSRKISLAAIIHPDDLPRVDAEIDRHLQERTPAFFHEYRLCTANGQVRWVEDRTVAVLDSDGRITHYQGIVLDITERRLATEAALEKTQGLLRCILDNSRDVAYKLNVQTWQYEYVSPSVSMFGINVDDFIAQGPKAYRARIHPDDEAVMAGLYERYFQDPSLHPLPATIEYRIRNDAGEYRWIADTFRAIRDAEGTTVAEVGNIRDVTEQKNAEALMLTQRDLALKLAGCSNLEEAVSLCLQTALVLAGMEAGGLYLVEKSTGAFHLASAVGLSNETMQEVAYAGPGSPWAQFLMKGQPVYCRYEEFTLGHGEAAARENLRALAMVPMLHGNTTIASVNLASRTIDEVPLANRRALETIAAHIGTTLARLQAEEALRESEEKYRSLVENAYDGICIVQEDRLKYLNPQLAQMLGAQPGEMLDTHIRGYFQSQAAFDLLQSAMASSQGRPTLIEAELVDRGGKTVEVEVKASQTMYMNVPATLVLVRDVTNRNLAIRAIEEQRLEIVAASRMSEMGMMASGVAHEINNPLAVISGVAEQLRELVKQGNLSADAKNEIAAQQIEKISRNAHRIERIISNMKAFARDGAADPLRTCSLATILADALDLCEARFAAHGVRLDVNPVPEGIALECRPAQIVQVLVNLLTNSFDAVEQIPDRWVRIDLGATTDWVELGVVDSGPTMDPLVREHALRPFFTTKEIGKGSGLGLTISKGIVENHHGTLAIDHNLGHTRFVVRLPRKQPNNQPQGEVYERS